MVSSTTAGSPIVGGGDCTTGEGGVLLTADSAGSLVVSGGGSATSTAARLPADRGGCPFRGTGTGTVWPTAANERQEVKSCYGANNTRKTYLPPAMHPELQVAGAESSVLLQPSRRAKEQRSSARLLIRLTLIIILCILSKRLRRLFVALAAVMEAMFCSGRKEWIT